MPTPTIATPADRASRYREAIVLAGILICTFVLQALSPVTTSTDSAWTFHVSASMLREANINLDEYRSLMDLNVDYRLRVIGGHIYSYYPVATPLLVVPVVWLANAVYPIAHSTDFYTYLATHAPDSRTARLEKLCASAIVALGAVLMYLLARTRLRPLQAAAIALIFAFATSMWSTASRALWQHGPSALFLTLALYLILVGADRPRVVLATGAILGFAYWIRPTNSLSVAFVGLYFFIHHRRRVGLFIAGALVVLVPFAIQNWFTYSNILPPYSYQLFEKLGSPAEVTQALAGTLISPNRGLFVFTPLFLFSLWGAYLSLGGRAPSESGIDLFLVGIVISHWIVTSLFQDWSGAWSLGPRYFADVIPYLVYFLVPVFEVGGLARPVVRYSFVGALAISVLIQARCSLSPYPFMWNGKPQALVEAPARIWDWGDLQFLRGLCPSAPLEGRAPACWLHHAS
jgi:hypothetical protein